MLFYLLFYLCFSAGERYEATDGSHLQQLRQFDHILMTYMRERRVPGASVAISKAGQVLLKKGEK